jgi:hypothetical protein
MVGQIMANSQYFIDLKRNNCGQAEMAIGAYGRC